VRVDHDSDGLGVRRVREYIIWLY